MKSKIRIAFDTSSSPDFTGLVEKSDSYNWIGLVMDYDEFQVKILTTPNTPFFAFVPFIA